MGFECGFIKIPKYSGVTPYQAIVAGEYFDYKKWLVSEWAQEQLKKGSELTFKGYYGMEEKDLPDPALLSEYKKIYYKETIDSYCSDGRQLDDKIIHSSAEVVDEEKLYYLMTSDLVDSFLAVYKKEAEDSRLLPVIVSNAYIINEKDRKELIPISGLELEFSDGTIRRVSSDELEEEQLFASVSYVDSDKRWFIERVKEAFERIKKETNWDKEYIIYFRSY